MPAGSTKTFGRYALTRPPRDNDELYSLVKALWGVTVPRGKVCPEHNAPFDWFADSFFARAPQTLVHGSRGLSGKSFSMATLGLTQAVVWGADVNLLGGSLAQSTNLHEHMRAMWDYEHSPRYMVMDESNIKILLSNHARIRPLTASQRTVRGPHPARLLLDEIDEMDKDILHAAMGQPMPQKNWLGVKVPAATAMASTWQNADGCILADTPVLTKRGWIKIQQVQPGVDQVPTRHGWCTVSHKVYVGLSDTVTVYTHGGQQLTCTPNHPLWSGDRFVAAAALTVGSPVTRVLSDPALVALDPAASTAQTTLRLPDTTLVEVVPANANRAVGSQLQVQGVHTSGDTTGVSYTLAIDWSQEQLVDVHVGGDHMTSDLLPATAVGDGSGPDDALLTGQIDGVIAYQDYVTKIEHTTILQPVWDLQVDPTHEYVAGGLLVHNTFASEYARFQENDLPIYTWCYKDSANPLDGWLDQETIEQKRREIPREMWRVEYDLGEPSIGNRAFDSDSVERMFDTAPPEPIKQTREHEEYRVENYSEMQDYVIAADWAKTQDWTVISVWKVTDLPMKLVYYVRIGRKPYPYMVGIFNKLAKEYHAEMIHDGTGLGSVVADLIDGRAWDFLMTGKQRDDMLSEYVAAVENDQVRAPKISTLYTRTKYCTVEDLYARGEKYHLPDEVCSSALAWKLVSGRFPAVMPFASPKRDDTWMTHQFEHNSEHYLANSGVRVDGDVSVKDGEELWTLYT